MNNKKSIIIIAGNLAVAILLIAAGILMSVYDSNIIENKKAIIGLAIIPLGIAFSAMLNLILAKKYPKGMKPVIIAENDERLIAIKNEADSMAFRVLRWALMLVFFGYTFTRPNDIFETFSWWTVFAFFFLSYILQGVFYYFADKKEIE